MTECTHDGDHWWEHDEKRSYCCECRQPIPSGHGNRRGGSGKWKRVVRSREHFDHYGNPIWPNRFNRGRVAGVE